jgi:hypothetical protein
MKFNIIQRTWSFLFAIIFFWLVWEVWILDIAETLQAVFFYLLIMVAFSGAVPQWCKKK